MNHDPACAQSVAAAELIDRALRENCTMRTFAEIRTAKVNDTTLAYREQGHGEPVVFVHGSASDLRTWEPQLPVVRRAWRAIAYSRRFARPNEDIAPGADDPMQPHVDDLGAFLREVDAAPAHLVGNSWGAFICLLAAIQHPDLVRTLVLEEPPILSMFVSTPPRPAQLLRLLATRPRTALAILQFGARTIAPVQKAFRRGEDDKAMLAFVHGVLGRDSYELISEERRQQMRDNLSALRAQLLGAGFPPLREAEVRNVRVPVLLVTGERSPAVMQRLSDRLEELLPDVEHVEIPAASHLMH
ncbi:MAG TPA: alpha/beta hydrolase, partial [Rhodanobacteraceae bacterium]|nr:alpha/beta hydrolase [Rhodanobacteraceae bacterium]